MILESNSIEIMPLNREEIIRLAEFYQLIWGGDFNQVLYKTRWAFDNEKSIVLIARDKNTGEIIGARGAIYWPIRIQDRILNTYQFHGTSVHPDYRRMGIFSKLNKNFLKVAHEKEIYGIFNISVEASMKGYQKLGWSYLPGFERLIKISNPIKMASKSLRKLSSSEHDTYDISPKSSEVFLDENLLEELLETRNREFRLINRPYVYYDKASFLQRLSNKFEGYQYLVYKDSVVVYKTHVIKGTYKGLLIGDILLNKNNFTLFKELIREITKKEKPDFLLTYISKLHPNYAYFKKSAFFSTIKKDMYFGTRIIDPENEDFFGETVWQTSIFDIDTF